MKIALVHDWLTGMRGGEKCLEALCQIYPQTEIFTLLHNRGSVARKIEDKKIHTSFIQNLPLTNSKYQHYLPLFPLAIEQFDFSDFDLVISSSHCVAKGAITKPQTCHICYCYTPMRYAWEMYPTYFTHGSLNWFGRKLGKLFMTYLRSWDEASASRPDYYVAISKNVQNRIRKHYRRESEVIYPPVEVDSFPLSEKPGEYFLVVSALVPYKRVDLAVQAFNKLGSRLIIIGEGSEKNSLTKMALKNIEFLPWQKQVRLKEYYSNCRALVFPGEEDFGIVPVEAQACGKPVIAFGRGGALETVAGKFSEEIKSTDTKLTGIFFREQTTTSLAEAIKKSQEIEFEPHFARQNSLKFDIKIFKEKIQSFVAEKFAEHNELYRV